MSLQAYRSASQQAESPRDLEYRLFSEVTRSLVAASEAERGDLQTRMRALDWNRRLWSVLAGDCANDANALPDQLRANIISLGLFVNRHTSEVMTRGESFEPLIEINRSIMQGLTRSPQAA